MDIIKQIEENIFNLNNQLVILDSNVADLYEVETKRVNEAVKNNLEIPKRFYSIKLLLIWVFHKTYK